MDFRDKKVLITGASRGIGRATAIAFAKAGAQVAVHYHQQRRAAEEVQAALTGTGHTIVQADVADPLAVERMVTETITALRQIDILVNSAGVFYDHPLDKVSYQE
jgi:3-oxoacyl-[acyl-carrier protein] reductase